VRPATRGFRRELDAKVERLQLRLDRHAAGALDAGQNPGFDRMAEALFLKGDWEGARTWGRKAADFWGPLAGAGGGGAAPAEATFHLGSALLFADDVPAARTTFARGVERYVALGQAASDDTGYMATAAGDLRRAEVIFQAATVADMGAQGMNDLEAFGRRFPDTPRLLKMRFAQGLARRDRGLVGQMRLMERWLTPEPEGVTSFRTEEWFYAAHQAVLAQLARGEEPRFRLYDDDVVPGLADAAPR
jgi:hypothetical protein